MDMWAHVIAAPLDRSTVVFKRGTSYGSIGLTLVGGHVEPVSTFGLNEEWKNAQKKAMKRNTSLTMNNNIPNRNPDSTRSVCLPCNDASRITSRHHCIIVKRTIINPTQHKFVVYLLRKPPTPAVN